METVKKAYEEPTVQKVEFDFKTRIAASLCGQYPELEMLESYCGYNND